MPLISVDTDACASHGLPHEPTMDVVASSAGLRAAEELRASRIRH